MIAKILQLIADWASAACLFVFTGILWLVFLDKSWARDLTFNQFHEGRFELVFLTLMSGLMLYVLGRDIWQFRRSKDR